MGLSFVYNESLIYILYIFHVTAIFIYLSNLYFEVCGGSLDWEAFSALILYGLNIWKVENLRFAAAHGFNLLIISC